MFNLNIVIYFFNTILSILLGLDFYDLIYPFQSVTLTFLNVNLYLLLKININ